MIYSKEIIGSYDPDNPEDDAVCVGGRVAPGHLYVNEATIIHFRQRR